MRVEDITDKQDLVKSTQDEAIKNINGGKVFDIQPDAYKERKEFFDPELQKMSLPSIASPTVAKNMSISPEHAAALMPESDIFSWVDRRLYETSSKIRDRKIERDTLNDEYERKIAAQTPSYQESEGYEEDLSVYDKLKEAVQAKVGSKLGPERRFIDLGFKRLLGQDLSEDEQWEYAALSEDSKNNFGVKEYGAWDFPLDVAAQVADTATMAARNKELIAGVIGAGAATGFGVGVAGGAILGPGSGVTGIGGAIAGGGLAIGPAMLAAGTYEGYKSMAAQTFTTLDSLTDADGNPIKIDDVTKRYISHGVGVVGSVIEFVGDKALLKNIPFIKKFFKPDAILKDPANASLKKFLIEIGKSASINATTEGFQEIVSIVGEEVGQTYKDGEVSFNGGLARAAEKLATKEGANRVGYSMAVGGGAAASFHAGFHGLDSALNRKKQVQSKSNMANPDLNMSVAPMIDILDFQDTLDATKMVTETTKLHKLAPEQTQALRKQMVEAGISHVWVDKEALEKFTGQDKAKAELVRNKIDRTGQAAAAINAPIKIPIQKALEIHDQYPDFSEHMQLEPNGPSPDKVKAFLEAQKSAEEVRKTVRAKLDVGEKTPAEQAWRVEINPAMTDEQVKDLLISKDTAEEYLKRIKQEEPANAEEIRKKVIAVKGDLPDAQTAKETLKQALVVEDKINDVFGEEDYLNQKTFPPALEKILPKNEVVEVTKSIFDGRKEIANNINETARLEMNKIIDLQEEVIRERQSDIEAEKIKNDPNVAVVDKFYGHNPDTVNLETHHKPGKSPFAIDPRLLNDRQKTKYLKDKQIRKHKAFAKGGLSPDAAARLVGVNSGENLLSILSRTPSRKDLIDANVKMRAKEIRHLAEMSVNLDETKISKAFHKVAENTLGLAKKVLDINNNRAVMDKMIKRIAIKPPTIKEVTRNAKNAVYQTKYADLDEAQFKVGERKSQSIGIHALQDGKFEKAYNALLAQTTNIALTNETHKAIAKVNRVIRFVQKINSDESRAILARAKMVDAVDELLDVFNFDPTKKGQSKEGAFQKVVREQLGAGVANLEIPAEFSEIRENINDMTVEEILVIGDRLKTLFKLASESDQVAAEINAVAEDLHAEAVTHPDYGKALIKGQGAPNTFENSVALADNAESWLTNMQFLLADLSNKKVGGKFVEAILAPLKGEGKYEAEGKAGKVRDIENLQKNFQKIINKVNEGASAVKKGLKITDWDKLQATEVFVEEFKDNPKLKHGKQTLGNLFVMALNIGNEGNLQRLTENLNIDRDVLQDVLDKYLDTKYVVAAQEILNLHEGNKERVATFHKERTGVDVEMVEATPFTHRGIVYPGGYYPIIYDNDLTVEQINKRIEGTKAAILGESNERFQDLFYADDMTKHRHTESRVGSDSPINLSMDSIGMGFEMIIHDLNYRRPLSRAMRILSHPTIAEDIKQILGDQKYASLVNSIVRVSGSLALEQSAILTSGKWWEKALARARGGLAVSQIVGKTSSILVQFASMPRALQRLGVNGMPYFLNTLGQMLDRPDLIFGKGGYFEFASDIVPSIKTALLGIDEMSPDPLDKFIPKKSRFPEISGVTRPLDAIRQHLVDVGFKPLVAVDQLMKVVVASSAYAQFQDGKVDGWPMDKLVAMTAAERDHQAKVYAASLTEMTLTAGDQMDRSEFQTRFKSLAMFHNDGRNALNNVLLDAKHIKRKLRNQDFGGAVADATTMMLTLGVTRLVYDLAKNNPTPLNDDAYEDDESKESRWLRYFGSSPMLVANDVPIIREGLFGLQSSMKAIENNWYKGMDIKIAPPAIKIGNDIATSVLAALEYMEFVEREPGQKEARAVLDTISYVTGGIPSDAMIKLYNAMEDVDFDSVTFVPALSDVFLKKFEKFKAEHSDDVDEATLKALDDIRVKIDKQNTEAKD